MADEPTLPTYKALLWPCLLSIAEDLHGSGQKSEIVDAVLERAHVTTEQRDVHYPSGASATGSKVEHRIAFGTCQGG